MRSTRLGSISPLSIWAMSALFATLVINHLFFNMGSLNYDLRAATVWVYVLYRHGIPALYHLPLTVSVADAWGGIPMQEAAFPYGPTMASVFLVIGWVYRLFFAPPPPLLPDPLQIAYVIRQFNVIFGLLNAVLISKILEEQHLPLRTRLISASLFLFNPAVWFVGSVWGQTQNISLAFLLLAIWLGEKGHPVLAWTAALLTSMTRDQMIAPTLLLALFFLRKFSFGTNICSLSWSIITTFLIVAPFSLAESPTLPLDVHVHAYLFHVLALNDRWSNPVSWGALSLWTLVARVAGGLSGLDRLSLPAMELHVGGLTYWQLANYAFTGLALACAVAVVLRPSLYLHLLAVITLGLFLVKTSFAAFHLIPAVALVIASRRTLGPSAYYLVVGILSATIFLSMYSMAAIWMTPHPFWAVGLFSPTNTATAFVQKLMNADWFVTSGSVLNLSALLVLAGEVLRRWRTETSDGGVTPQT